MRIAAILLSIVLFFEALYCFLVFTDIPAIKNLREAYISTALSTRTHMWLAEALLPQYMVDEVRMKETLAMQAQSGINSQRPKPTEPLLCTSTPQNPFSSA